MRSINTRRADVIVLGSTTMHQSYGDLAAWLPVPVINPGLIMYELCEVLLYLVLSHSKHAFPPPEIPKDDDIFTRLASAKPQA